MKNSNHPEKEDIYRYLAKELPEEEEIALGEHLDGCLECRSLTQETFKNKLLWVTGLHGSTARLTGRKGLPKASFKPQLLSRRRI